jgi:hypothetical protein
MNARDECSQQVGVFVGKECAREMAGRPPCDVKRNHCAECGESWREFNSETMPGWPENHIQTMIIICAWWLGACNRPHVGRVGRASYSGCFSAAR